MGVEQAGKHGLALQIDRVVRLDGSRLELVSLSDFVLLSSSIGSGQLGFTSLAASDQVLADRDGTPAAGLSQRLPSIFVLTGENQIPTIGVLAEDVMLLRIKLPAAQRLQFLAGQYLEILLPDGKRRAFSIASSPQSEGGSVSTGGQG